MSNPAQKKKQRGKLMFKCHIKVILTSVSRGESGPQSEGCVSVRKIQPIENNKMCSKKAKTAALIRPT